MLYDSGMAAPTPLQSDLLSNRGYAFWIWYEIWLEAEPEQAGPILKVKLFVRWGGVRGRLGFAAQHLSLLSRFIPLSITPFRDTTDD